MPKGIGILLITHIFKEKHIINKTNSMNLSDEYIFGKKNRKENKIYK